MTNKQTRSVKLRKYEEAYKSCVKRQKNKKEKSPRPQRRKSTKHKKSPIKPPKLERSKKRPLNKYQKFVRDQSKKSIYKNMTGKERFSAISKKWNKIK